MRRLEFVIAEAMERSCKHILTTGTVTSNQCRATAVACAELGLKAHLFLMSKEKVNLSKELRSKTDESYLLQVYKFT